MRQPAARPVVLATVGVLDSVVLAVLINVATGGTVPAALAGLRGWVWPAIVLFALIGAGNAVVAAVPHRRARRVAVAGHPDAVADPVVPLHLRARNPHFTGRQRLLDRTRDLLAARRPAGVPAVAFVGMGGVGKTELAIEYAHRFAASYRLICVLSAETPATLEPDLIGLARTLGLPDDRDTVVDRVLRELQAYEGWLLVFDNAPSLADIARYLPAGGAGHILVTSRHPAWRQRASVLSVDSWTTEEAAGFLCGRLHRPGQEEAAAAVAGLLGRLPLALEQAAGYMEQQDESFLAYVRVFEDRKRRVLGANPPVGLAYRETVATTWAVSVGRLESDDPAAADLLRLCAFLAPDSLDDALFDADPGGRVSDLVGSLHRYSLVKRDGPGFSLHRLVQEVIRLSLTDDQHRTLIGRCLGLLALAADGPRRDDPAILAHVLAVLPHATAPEQVDAAEALLRRMGAAVGRLIEQGGTQQSVAQARMITGAVSGEDNPAVTRVLAVLGEVLYEQGSRVAARACFEQALAIALPVYGADHPIVIDACNKLAMLLRQQGDFRGSDRYLRRAAGEPSRRIVPWRR